MTTGATTRGITIEVAPAVPDRSRCQRPPLVSVEPPGIRRPASVAPRTSRETTTFVHDPRRSARPGDKHSSSSNPGSAANSRGIRNNPADGTNPPKKTASCVTTRGRNRRRHGRFRRGPGLAAARPLRLGVLSFGGLIPTPLRLTPRSLPAANLAQALRLLTVPLVPLPGNVPASTPFAQAHPRPRSSDSGMATVTWIIVVSAHGSVCFSQGKSGENACYVLLGRSSKPEPDKESKSAPAPRTRRRKKLLEKSHLERNVTGSKRDEENQGKETVLEM